MITVPTPRFLQCGGKTICIREWGNRNSPAVVIWHGVNGTSTDHRLLASALCDAGYYVVCPDAVGCGLSEWPTLACESSLSFHVEIVDDLLQQLSLDEVRWIGTSKGGALGIVYGAQGTACSLRQLVLHDVGPSLPKIFRDSVIRLLAEPPRFGSLMQFQSYLRKSLSRAGLHLSDSGWLALAEQWHRRCDDGSITYHHAPALADQFLHHPEDFDLWPAYEALRVETMLIRGEKSSIIPAAEIERMANSGPGCRVETRPGGHISFLATPEEQHYILDFFGHTPEKESLALESSS